MPPKANKSDTPADPKLPSGDKGGADDRAAEDKGHGFGVPPGLDVSTGLGASLGADAAEEAEMVRIGSSLIISSSGDPIRYENQVIKLGRELSYRGLDLIRTRHGFVIKAGSYPVFMRDLMMLCITHANFGNNTEKLSRSRDTSRGGTVDENTGRAAMALASKYKLVMGTENSMNTLMIAFAEVYYAVRLILKGDNRLQNQFVSDLEVEYQTPIMAAKADKDGQSEKYMNWNLKFSKALYKDQQKHNSSLPNKSDDEFHEELTTWHEIAVRGSEQDHVSNKVAKSIWGKYTTPADRAIKATEAYFVEITRVIDADAQDTLDSSKN
jgi:hypothetical protein